MNSQVTNVKTREWQALSRDHHLPPFTDYKQLNERGVWIITKAEGVYIWNSEGNEILDAMAGFWCVNVGYGREEPAQAAIRQMRELSFYNLSFQTAHPSVVELAKAIVDTAPEGINHVFFTDSGSEANDTVLRMICHYWATKGQPQKKMVISRWNGYYGLTVAGVNLGGMKALHEQGDFPIPGIVHIIQPHWYGEGGNASPDEFGVWVAEQSEKKILEVGEENVAAFIVEPIQGAGGVIVPSGTYWSEIHEILAKYNILFIADGVICGFGRTDEWFGSQYYGNIPDLMSIAKGLTSGYIPVGEAAVRDEIAEVPNQGDGFYHDFTYSGHPVAAAVALENICILREEKTIEKVKAEMAPYLQKRWQGLVDHPLMGEACGVGIVAALELARNRKTRERFTDEGAGMLCREYCSRDGLIMRVVGDIMIISPLLVIDPLQIDELVTLVRRCLDQAAAAVLA